MLPSIADRVKDKQCQQKTAHDYHAKEREIQEGQAVYIKEFPAKKTWSPGTVVSKTGPVSAQAQLVNGTIVRRHQDHIRHCEQKVVMPLAEGGLPEDVPVVLLESTTPPIPEFSDSPETPKSSPAVSVEEAVQASSQMSRPVRRRARPEYLKDYVC